MAGQVALAGQDRVRKSGAAGYCSGMFAFGAPGTTLPAFLLPPNDATVPAALMPVLLLRIARLAIRTVEPAPAETPVPLCATPPPFTLIVALPAPAIAWLVTWVIIELSIVATLLV